MGRFMGRFASPQHPYLRQRYRNWYVRLAVPTDVRGSIGTTVRELSLKTRAMDVALQRARPILEKWEAEFEACRHQAQLDEHKLRYRTHDSELRAYGYLQDNPIDGAANLKLMGKAASLFTQTHEECAVDKGVSKAIARVEKGYPAPPPLENPGSRHLVLNRQATFTLPRWRRKADCPSINLSRWLITRTLARCTL